MGKISGRFAAARKAAMMALAGLLILTGLLSVLGAAPGEAAAAGAANLAVNPGFEDGTSETDYAGWTYDGPAGALKIKGGSEGNLHSGSNSAQYYSDIPYQFTLSQTITGLADGKYTLRAWSSGDAGNKPFRLFVDGYGGDRRETAIENGGWQVYTEYKIEHIQVTSGQATIGFAVDSYGGKWGWFDDVQFYKEASTPTWGADKSLTASEAGPTSIKLIWSGVNGAADVTGYRIYQDGQPLANVSADTTKYEAIELSPATDYTFAVQAVNAAGEWSEDGPSGTFATAATAAASPVWSDTKSLAVSSLTAHGAVLNWSGASDEVGVTGYRIYVDGVVKAVVGAAATSFALTGLTPGASYRARVEAGNAASLWSTDGPTLTFATPTASGDDFIKGADISTLQAIEDAGGKYYEGGVQKDLLAILKAHGVNYIRLRIWNDPVLADGYNDMAHTLAMAKRVKEAGLKLLLDFHYSDFWTDPGKQVKPAAWEGLSYDQLKQAMYDYTADVLNGLKAEGAYPDMVQVGNEINPGILLPDGAIGNYDKLAGLLKSGIQAVRDTSPAGQDVKVMLHLAEGGNNAFFRTFFDAMTARNVDFDVIGASYYPFWHGTLQQLKTNLNDLAARYGKQVVVAETSYGYTFADGDGWPNSFGQAEADESGFPATVAGQKRLVTTVMNTVAHVPDGLGLGVFYWEPAWIPVPKDANGDYQAGWKTKEGNAWDNQAMFDFAGNALDSLDAFRFEPGDLPDVLPLSVRNPVGIAVPANTPPADVAALLPATADVLYNEGTIMAKPVVWQDVDPEDLSRIGTFKLAGQVEGTGETAEIAITVTAYRNVLVNPGFEQDYDMTGWTFAGTDGAAKVKDSSADAYSGTRAVNYYAGSDFAFTLSQTVTDIPNGEYTLKAKVSGGGGDRAVTLRASGFGGDELVSDNIVNTGWRVWNDATIEHIQVTNHTATVSLAVDAPGGTWGWVDDFQLYRKVDVPEWTGAKSLTASGSSARQVTLAWSGVKEPAGLAGYKVYKDGKLLATVTDTTYKATGLTPNTSYSFRVEASYDGTVWTSTGPTLSVKTLAETGGTTSSGTGGETAAPGGGDGGTATIGAAQLSALGAGAPLVLPAGTTAVKLPANAASLLAGDKLTLRTAEGLDVELPAALLKAWAALLGTDAADGGDAGASGGADGGTKQGASVSADEGAEQSASGGAGQGVGKDAGEGTIALTLKPLAPEAAESLRALAAGKAGAAVRLAGGTIYDFGVTLAAADGTIAATPKAFAEPILLRFAPGVGAAPDAAVAGVYYIADDGTLSYVGGKRTDGGAYEAEVRHFSKYALLEVDRSFADVPASHWASAAVRMLAARQIVAGSGGDRFEPGREVTRAEFAAMLVRALASANVAASDGTGGAGGSAAAFADVPQDAWYASAVAQAAGLGVVAGRSERIFDPSGAITREEMAAMAARAYALLHGVAVPAAADGAVFADEAELSAWARPYAQAAAAWGLAQGRGAGRFAPQGVVTRAEAAQIVANALREQ